MIEEAPRLLLAQGADDIDLQINDQRCAREDFEPLFVGSVETSGIRENVPPWVKALGKIGVVVVDNSVSMQELQRGIFSAGESYLLFRGRHGFRAAYSIARRLAKATRGNPAAIGAWEWSGITWGILSPRQPFIGREED